MQCQQCRRELLPGAEYCAACGAQIQPQCRSCQTLNPPGSRFCFSCGNQLPSASTENRTAVRPGAGPSTLVCARCHQGNEPSSTYCYSCGLPLDRAGQLSNSVDTVPAYAMGPPGGFWIRLLAYLIDGVLLTALFILAWPIISGESIADYWASSEDLTGGDLFSLTLNLVYYTGAVAIWATTIGKRPFRLYVVRTDGSRVGIGRALARYLAYVPSAIILGGGFLMIAWRQDKRGLHDLICDTVVIRR